MAIAADRQINTDEDIRKVDAVGSGERPLQDWLGYFKSDELVICVRCVVPFSDLIDIKTKFDLRVCGWLLIIGDDGSILLRELGDTSVQPRGWLPRVSFHIGGVVGKGTRCKRIFVQIL
jgi:hypothetical protein